ncbi:MAG: efflux RND transporter periplasmic adaptor subunit [Gammaproteobacteria bacterium]|nr:MAG: efflux RND transporter periplasmic adaptor subunit [Gammaproteobacteria bacterium]
MDRWIASRPRRGSGWGGRLARRLGALGVPALLLLACIGWPAAGLAAQAGPAAALRTAPVRRVQVDREVRLDGTIEAVKRATVQAQTGGEVMEILFDVDDYVERGAVLLRMKDTEQRARVRRAEAALAEAEAHLRQAEAEYRRIRDIFARKLVSRSAMDRATAERKAARARVRQARAALAEAREQLEHTVVRAPYSGIVVERHVEVGEIATPGKPLMTGISLEVLRAVVQLPQQWVNAVRRQHHARVYWRDRVFDSDRVTVYPLGDARAHTFKTRIRLEGDLKGLYPGMLVKVGFRLGQAQVLAVPASAVFHRSEVTGVYVVDAEGIHLRQVRAGRALDGGRVEILSGLQAGERVALDPVRAAFVLKQGARGPAHE